MKKFLTLVAVFVMGGIVYYKNKPVIAEEAYQETNARESDRRIPSPEEKKVTPAMGSSKERDPSVENISLDNKQYLTRLQEKLANQTDEVTSAEFIKSELESNGSAATEKNIPLFQYSLKFEKKEELEPLLMANIQTQLQHIKEHSDPKASDTLIELAYYRGLYAIGAKGSEDNKTSPEQTILGQIEDEGLKFEVARALNAVSYQEISDAAAE